MDAVQPPVRGLPRGIILRSAAQAGMALRLARELGCAGPLSLVSPPGAARWLGPRLFLAMVEAAARSAPGLVLLPALDCRGAPGFALAALRAGVPVVVLEPGCPAFPAVAEAAAALPGVALWPAPPPALDLGPRNSLDPATQIRLHQWLGTEEAGG
ncbi:MAG TPA: hypothetical protein VNZ61_11550 [Roseomonas sp.]|nr:hypothetical protein [Roseomonas sp.]